MSPSKYRNYQIMGGLAGISQKPRQYQEDARVVTIMVSTLAMVSSLSVIIRETTGVLLLHVHSTKRSTIYMDLADLIIANHKLSGNMKTR